MPDSLLKQKASPQKNDVRPRTRPLNSLKLVHENFLRLGLWSYENPELSQGADGCKESQASNEKLMNPSDTLRGFYFELVPIAFLGMLPDVPGGLIGDVRIRSNPI